MSQSKTDGMKYVATGRGDVKDTDKVAINMAKQLSSSSLVWLLVKRHKVALLSAGNIVLVLNWVFPAWVTFIGSLFAK